MTARTSRSTTKLLGTVSLRFVFAIVTICAIAAWGLWIYLEGTRCYLIVDSDSPDTVVLLNGQRIGVAPVRIEMTTETRRAVASGELFGSFVRRHDQKDVLGFAFLPNRGQQLVFQFAKADAVDASQRGEPFVPARLTDIRSAPQGRMALCITVSLAKN